MTRKPIATVAAIATVVVGTSIGVALTQGSDGPQPSTAPATYVVKQQPGRKFTAGFGAPTVGETIHTTNGTWGNNPSSFAYAWQDCDTNGANCTTAAGSPTNAADYTVVAGDEGHTLRVTVTASNAQGSASQTSAATAVVPNGGLQYPLYASNSYWNTPITASPTIAANNNGYVNTATYGMSSSTSGTIDHSAGGATTALFVATNSDPLETVKAFAYPSCTVTATEQVHIPAAAATALDNSSYEGSEGPGAVLNTDTGVEYNFYHWNPPGHPIYQGSGGVPDGCTAGSYYSANSFDDSTTGVAPGNFVTGPGLNYGFHAARNPEASGLILQHDVQAVPASGSTVGITYGHALVTSYKNVATSDGAGHAYWLPAYGTDGSCSNTTVCLPEGERPDDRRENRSKLQHVRGLHEQLSARVVQHHAGLRLLYRRQQQRWRDRPRGAGRVPQRGAKRRLPDRRIHVSERL